uniref:Uncharacterized protein n=1 Tax=Cucumis melo TaxID=3656 RepID=A0A9I9EJK4_CUCME
MTSVFGSTVFFTASRMVVPVVRSTNLASKLIYRSVIRQWILKQVHHKLDSQNPSHSVVDSGHRNGVLNDKVERFESGSSDPQVDTGPVELSSTWQLNRWGTASAAKHTANGVISYDFRYNLRRVLKYQFSKPVVDIEMVDYR